MPLNPHINYSTVDRILSPKLHNLYVATAWTIRSLYSWRVVHHSTTLICISANTQCSTECPASAGKCRKWRADRSADIPKRYSKTSIERTQRTSNWEGVTLGDTAVNSLLHPEYKVLWSRNASPSNLVNCIYHLCGWNLHARSCYDLITPWSHHDLHFISLWN